MNARAPDGSPQIVDLSKGVFKKAIQERQLLVKRCLKLGMTYRGIEKMLESFYFQNPNLSPWIWIRKEYKPTQQTKNYIGLFERSKERRQKATSDTKPLYDHIAKLEKSKKSRIAKINKQRGKQ